MNQIKVLIEGYAKETESGWIASSSVTLVKAGDKNVIVDTGCNRQRLLAELESNNLKTEDIDFILLTHSHADHSLLAGIFEKAKVLTVEEIYDNDHQTSHGNVIPGTDLEIVQSSGHCPEHCSLVVSTADGVYVVAGDVFWWMDNEEQKLELEKEDDAHPAEVDAGNLVASRKKLLGLADYIIPGHGKMFKVER